MWTAEATYSKLPEKKWRERHFVCFAFVHYLFIILPFIRFYEVKLSKLQWQRQRVRWLCKVRYNFLFISLLLFTKVHKTTTWNRHMSSAYLRECELNDGQFLKFLLSNFEAVLQILFGIFLTLYRLTEWIQLLARFVSWILRPCLQAGRVTLVLG